MANHEHGFSVKDQVRETFPAFYKKDEILTIFALNKSTATVHDILGAEELIDYRMLKKVPIVKPKKDKPKPPKKEEAKTTKKPKVPFFETPPRICKTDMCDGERLLYGHYCQKCNDLPLAPAGAPPVEGIGPPPEQVLVRCPGCKDDKPALEFKRPPVCGSRYDLCKVCYKERMDRDEKGETKRPSKSTPKSTHKKKGPAKGKTYKSKPGPKQTKAQKDYKKLKPCSPAKTPSLQEIVDREIIDEIRKRLDADPDDPLHIPDDNKPKTRTVQESIDDITNAGTMLAGIGKKVSEDMAEAIRETLKKMSPVGGDFLKVPRFQGGRLQMPGKHYKEQTLTMTVVTDPDDPALFTPPTVINVYRCKNEHGPIYILAHSFADAETEFKRTHFDDNPQSIKLVCGLNKCQAIFYLNNDNQEELDKCP